MKIQRISQYQPVLPLTTFGQNYTAYQTAFLETDLGKIWTAIPWQDLVDCLGLKDAAKGPQSIFSPKGKVALMFLKHYAGCSDNKLIQQLNGNIDYQFFCDIFIPPSQRIENYKIVSEIRCQIAAQLNFDEVQKVLAKYWGGYCTNKNSIVMDATCYESYIRYPTDVKLLWESVSWSYVQLKYLSRARGVYTILTKIGKWTKRYLSYSKQKTPRKKSRRSLTRGLLKLLKKIDGALDQLELMGSFNLPVPKMANRIKILGADSIYANNSNRVYVTTKNIKTDFKRKGKPCKYRTQFAALAKAITKQRASAMEGSFGTDKEHFLLKRIKARTEATERLWIFFGIYTSNALKIGRRMVAKKTKAA